MLDSVRLDVYVASELGGIPRGKAKQMIESGKVTVNAKTAKPSYIVRVNDKVKIDSKDLKQKIPKINLPIIYEDDDCVVIDKPVGLLAHSKGAYNPEATVATWLAEKYSLDNSNQRVGIVHRLDRATSGVMICAKTQEALSWLQKQFSSRKVKKTYTALIEGVLEPEEAIIDMPIQRNPKEPQKFKVGPNGKSANTHYKIIDTKKISDIVVSTVELKPKTGRTHQLRVHLKHLKRPIIGDTFYDGRPAKRLYLHASQLELTLPNKERKVFISKVPSDFSRPKI